MNTISTKLASSLRILSIDAIQKASSGHPGMPMGMADIATVLWHNFLRHNPNNPSWLNRDRFIISNGHGSMLLYSLLHFTGYNITIEDIKNFRQLHSKTPGHPEFGITDGVEATTGPLGQGFSNAVGMAIAEAQLSSIFNKKNYNIIDHFTYAFVGDGCLMEGLSHEAASLAGYLKLGKLIVFYDDNNITIDGNTNLTFKDNTAQRFKSYNWHVISKIDGHNFTEIKNAIEKAQKIKNRPSIIICKTIIGYGAPTLAGTSKTHGSPLGANEIAKTRENINWEYPPFVFPQEIYSNWNAKEKGQKIENDWEDLFSEYQKKYPKLALELQRRTEQKFPPSWVNSKKKLLKKVTSLTEPIATRKASQICIEELVLALPELIGGSADLTESNLTDWNKAISLKAPKYRGRYIHYGIREFAMTGIMNGIALHKGLIPFGGTFLVFSDYARGAIRLSSLMKQRVILIYTHDSIGLGEDGPTHQPIEHATTLRAIPNMSVWRPCDVVETAYAWLNALEHQGPTALLLSRQALPYQTRSEHALDDINKGGYIIKGAKASPKVIIIATGSEVKLALDVQKELEIKNIDSRVVSMPSIDYFEKQSVTYKEHIIPKDVPIKIAIEAGHPYPWYKYTGDKGFVIGIDQFGASGPADKLFYAYNFNKEYIVNKIMQILNI